MLTAITLSIALLVAIPPLVVLAVAWRERRAFVLVGALVVAAASYVLATVAYLAARLAALA